MSVSPLQKSANPSVVPGPSTATSTPVFAPWKFSATSEVIGSTVDEPEMLSDPVRSPPPVAPEAPLDPLLSLLLPQAAATIDRARSPATTPASFLASRMVSPPCERHPDPSGRCRSKGMLLRRDGHPIAPRCTRGERATPFQGREVPGRSHTGSLVKPGGTLNGAEMNTRNDGLHFARERCRDCRSRGGRSRRRHLGGTALPERPAPSTPGREPAVGRGARGPGPKPPRKNVRCRTRSWVRCKTVSCSSMEAGGRYSRTTPSAATWDRVRRRSPRCSR